MAWLFLIAADYLNADGQLALNIRMVLQGLFLRY